MRKFIGYARGRRTVRVMLDGMHVSTFTVVPNLKIYGRSWQEHVRNICFANRGSFHVEIDISRDPMFML